MINSGMLLSGRYEIIERIGSGGMADVFKAKDTRLNRLVAIKVLKQEFSEDTNFIARFTNEAQSAAGLSHPNIVNVFDVGVDEYSNHYIVMELVEGITLKRFIEKKGKLEVREAVGISIQIAQGMEAAHSKSIVHRDIKPQNIMISREGKVKVADFGIAKMVSANTFTQSAVGSVHYLSPEQARGGYSDAKSDIYSLGVTLYEMLTGELPFAGESDVAVALSHINDEPRHTREIVPTVPYSLDRVVQKCMQKHPENRYHNVSDLILDLKHSITNPDGDFVVIEDATEVPSGPTRKFTAEEAEAIKDGKEIKKTETAAKTEAVRIDKRKNDNPKVLHDEPEELDSVDSRWEKAIIIISIIACVALTFGIVMLIIRIFGLSEIMGPETTPTPKPTQVVASTTPEPTGTEYLKIPSVLGYSFEDAEKVLKALSPQFTVIEATSDYSTEPVGTVLKQYPPAYTDALPDTTIRLTLSAGPEPLKVPRLVGLTQEAATSVLRAEGFEVIPEFISSDTVQQGLVIKTVPGYDETVHDGEKITLYVSSGVEIKYGEIPSLVGKTVEAADEELKSQGLYIGKRTQDYSEEFEAGLVIQQSRESGTVVVQGTSVDIVISLGKAPEGYVPTPTPTPTDIPGTTGGNDYPGTNPGTQDPGTQNPGTQDPGTQTPENPGTQTPTSGTFSLSIPLEGVKNNEYFQNVGADELVYLMFEIRVGANEFGIDSPTYNGGIKKSQLPDRLTFTLGNAAYGNSLINGAEVVVTIMVDDDCTHLFDHSVTATLMENN